MMTKEEVASIVKYCNDNGVSYKARLSELAFQNGSSLRAESPCKGAGVFRINYGRVPSVDCRRRLRSDAGICGEDRKGVL